VIFASVGAYGFSFATDLVVGAALRVYPSAVFRPFGAWSVISAIAFPTALAARGPAWTVWLPCAIFAGLAAHGAYGTGSRHRWIVAATLIGQAILVWWAMRPQLPRAQPPGDL
jgi:hypothetical protein